MHTLLILSSTLLALSTVTPHISEQQRQQQNRQRPPIPTTEQIMQRLPDGVTFIPNIAYREGNEAWKLDLAMPEERGHSPRPAIVFIHGGGWRNGDKRAAGFLNLMLSYAAKGYVCITVNYRLQTGNTPRINECVEDVKNAVRWLRAHAEKYNVDPDRTVGVYQADTFIAALREAGAKDVNYVLFGDGTGHGIFQRNISVTEPLREAFFKRILKP